MIVAIPWIVQGQPHQMTIKKTRALMNDNPVLHLFFPICFCSSACDYNEHFIHGVTIVASNKLLDKTVCIVGLGYVGLPLAQDFSEHIRTIGYRRDQKKVDELNTTPGNKIEATTDPAIIRQADGMILTQTC